MPAYGQFLIGSCIRNLNQQYFMKLVGLSGLFLVAFDFTIDCRTSLV